MKRRKALFLDRDGVVNESPGKGRYVLNPDQIRLKDGIADVIRQFRAAGFLIVVVTNQSCVAKGLLTIEMLHQIHEQVQNLLLEQNSRIDAFYFCPHHQVDRCDCRKPRSGMLIRAAQKMDIDLSHSVLIGDATRDIAAGKAVGCHSVWLNEEGLVTDSCTPDTEVKSLSDLDVTFVTESQN